MKMGKKSAPRSLLLHDLEQLDLEDERRAGLDRGRRAAVAVGDVRGADETALAAHLHELQPLGPALDDAVQREGRRLAALDGAVEHRAVGQRALVVDLHRVGGLGRVPRARLDLGDDEAGGRLGRALLARRLLEEGLARLLLDLGAGGGARLSHPLDLRAEGLDVDLALAVEDPVGWAGLDEIQLLLGQVERSQLSAEPYAVR